MASGPGAAVIRHDRSGGSLSCALLDAGPKAGKAASRTQKCIDLRHHLEGVGHVQDVSFVAGPSAIRIEVDGAPLANKSPTHGVRLLAVAARGKPLWMTRRGP